MQGGGGDEARRKKDREEILLAMGRMLDQIKEEREAFERKLDQKNREATERVDYALEQGDAHAQKIEERVTRVQRETVSTLQRIEEKLDDSVAKIEKKVDLSSKAITTMTTVAIFGFAAVTVAVMVLFVVLLTGL